MLRYLRVATRTPFRLVFGLLAIVLGCSLIVWIICNEFIHRFPEYTGTRWWEPFGIAPTVIGVGIYWLRTLHSPSGPGSSKPNQAMQLTAPPRTASRFDD
jgi:hypothetical protein